MTSAYSSMLLLLGLAAFFTAGLADKSFIAKGNWAGINAAELDGLKKDVLEREHENVKQFLKEKLQNGFVDFEFEDFETHGHDEFETAVFHAILTVSDDTTRDVIVEATQDSEFDLYFLQQTEFLQQAKRRWVSQTSEVLDVQTNCYYGGVLLPNGTCACNDYTRGADCSIFVCKNGGIYDQGRCVCPPGLYSLHCEQRSCVPKVESAFDFTYESFLISVNLKSSMAFDLQQIIEGLPTLFKDFGNLKLNPFKNFVVTVYRQSASGNFFLETELFDSVSDVIIYLSNVVIGTGAADQPHLDAIVATQNFTGYMQPESTFFAFIDSEELKAANASTYLSRNNESHAIQQTIAWRNKLVLVLSTSRSSPLKPDNSNEFDVLRRITTATHGDLITVYKDEIATLFSDAFPYFYEIQNTFVQYKSPGEAVINIKSDQATQASLVLITVEFGGQLPSLTSNKDETPEVKGAFFSLYRVYQSAASQISLHGGANYNVRIWINSIDTAIVSYSDNVDTDAGHLYTFSGFQQIASIYTSVQAATSITIQRYDSKAVAVGSASNAALRENSDVCSFAYQTASLATCTEGPFSQEVAVSDVNGKVISRFLPGYCVSTNIVNSTGWSCQNGGTRTGTAGCTCTSSYTGQHCEIPVCINGGYPDPYPSGNGHGKCVCGYGYQGDFCEKLVCQSTSDDTFTSRKRSFAIVIQTSLSAANDLEKLYDSVNLLFQGGNNTDDFDDYLLTTFNNRIVGNDTTPLIITDKFSTASAFLEALKTENLRYVYSPTGPQPGLDALATTINSIENDKSSIFFFTDSPAETNDKLFQDVVNVATSRQIEISVVQVRPFGLLERCQSTSYFQLARHAGGNSLNFCQKYTTSGDPLTNFIASYGSTHHHTEVIAYQLITDVSTPTNVSFTVSDPTAAIYVVANSPTVEKFNVSVINVATGLETTLTADAHSVPFFASFKVNADSSSAQYIAKVIGSASGVATLKVTEKSQLSVYIGFSPDPSTDKYSKSLLYGSPSALVLHVTSSLQSVPTVQLTTYDSNGLVVYKDVGQKRTGGCKYEYFFYKDIVCDNAFQTFTVTATLTTPEVTIQRTQRAFCYMDSTTCLNGGLSVQNICQCINGYTGTYCEHPPCQNGGQSGDFKCQCPLNYGGNLCQYRECTSFNALEVHDPRNLNFQQVTFLVEVDNINMLAPLVRLQQMIADVVNQTEDSYFPKQFSLVVFNADGSSVKASTAHAQLFIDSVKSLSLSNFTYVPSAVDTNDAILKAYQTTIEWPGLIHLFTSAEPTNSHIADVIRQRYGVQINVYHFGSLSSPKVSEIKDLQAGIARQSGGRILPVTPLKFPQIIPAIANMPNENQLILDDGAADCRTLTSFSFTVESAATALVFTATGINVTLLVYDQNKVYKVNQYLFNDDSISIVRFANLSSPNGVWRATLSTPVASDCYLQVRAETPLHVIAGFTNDENDDYPSATPRVGGGTNSSSYVTFRIADSFSSGNTNYLSTVDSVETYSVDLATPYNPTSLTNYTVNARNPVSCASQFVTPLIQWTATYEKFIVKGKDSKGNGYQRTFFFSQAAVQPCIHGTSDNYGFCACDAYHTGPSCNYNICQNGGTTSYGVCDCVNGYYGTYCEKLYKGTN